MLSSIFSKCFGPARHIDAPLSGKNLSVVLFISEIFLACPGSGLGENGIADAFISSIWLPFIEVYGPVFFFLVGDAIWATTVLMGAQ